MKKEKKTFDFEGSSLLWGIAFAVIFIPVFDNWIIGAAVGFPIGFVLFGSDDSCEKEKKCDQEKDD